MNDKGVKYEKIARDFLENKGCKIVAQNFFCPQGEIDLVALDKAWLCFVEVRYRWQNLDTAILSVDQKKAEKINLAAQKFLEQNSQFENFQLRFDLIAVSNSKIAGKYAVQHLKNFF